MRSNKVMNGRVADLFRAIKLKSYQVQMVVEGLSLRFFSSLEKISPTLNFELKKRYANFIFNIFEINKKISTRLLIGFLLFDDNYLRC